ncbi:MAG TPA: enoyl-CoA hydratase-related protein [Solirubrobacterales bacterium]|nr:enoyl-CoA hydratase-related protein [Solirubrobacterales bacterium]
MNPEGYETLELERFGSVLRVTLNRPERRNALSVELMEELLDLISKVEADAGTRVLVLRGAGKSFCSGYDIAGAAPVEGETPPSPIAKAQEVRADSRIFDRLWRLPILTIAQVHGACLAAGTDLALHCDLIICADDARIGYPAVRSMGAPATHMWLYQLGPQWTKRLLLSGDSVTGAKAVEIGFALEALAAEALDEHVLRQATRISSIPRDLLTVNKHVINRGLDLMGRTLLQETAVMQDILGRQASGTEEFVETAMREGLKQAFAQRDAPFADGDPIE